MLGTDEIHQLFVPGRSGMIQDVYIDSLGVITGVLFMDLILKIYYLIKNLKLQDKKKG